MTPSQADARAAVRPSGLHDLIVATATPDDYVDIERVSRAADRAEVFSPLTAPLLEWFLDRNPCGRGFCVVARVPASGPIVGHFVFYRWTLRRRIAGAVMDVPAALYVRLYVDPAQRRRGIFAAMTQAGLERLASLGVPVAYTAPNPRSSQGFVKFGMQRIGPLPFRVRPALPGWLWIVGAHASPRTVGVERRERFDDAFAAPFEANLPPDVVLWSPRTAAMLNWRYVDRPDASYEIRYLVDVDRAQPVGYVVTRAMTIKGKAVVAVCDAWTAGGHEQALRVGTEDALRAHRGARGLVAIGASADPRMMHAFSGAGFVRCPTKLLPQPVVIFGGAVPSAREGVALPGDEAWYLTPYDWDVF